MAYQAHISLKGKKQGQFKGEGIQDKRKDKWLPVLSFDMEVVSPRDIATGQASGKRQWKPVSIVKEWGAASPQILAACATNEVLPEVVIEFSKTNPNGEEYVYQQIKLTDATISSVDRFTGDREGAEGSSSARHTLAVDTHELEKFSLTFRKIELTDNDGKTNFADDWSTTN
jgi:type VI secretion system secreted protein Hcp